MLRQKDPAISPALAARNTFYIFGRFTPIYGSDGPRCIEGGFGASLRNPGVNSQITMPEPPLDTAENVTEAIPLYSAPAFPANEELRQQALDRYQILDTEAEQSFDDLTRLAQMICGTPIAAISLLDHGRQWFKSRIGLDVDSTPRDWSFCAHAIHEPDRIFEIPDAREDPRFARNPLVEGGPQVRFYAGAPLVNPEGLALGVLCVIDQKARKLTPEQAEALACLGRQVAAQMELRASVFDSQERTKKLALMNARSLRLQAHLAGSERRFRLLAEASTDIIVLLDLTGLQHYVSPAMERVLGWQAQGMSGRAFQELTHPEDLGLIQKMFRQCREGAVDGPVEYRCQRADGRYTWLEVNLRLYHDADSNAPGGFVAVARDITLRKALEEERQRAFHVMEQANEELAKSRAAAVRTSKAKSDFLSNMSHEIRTPMNGVLGMLQLLQATALSEEQQRYLEIAQSSGRTLLALIDDILDLSKIEAGKLAIECLDFELNQSVEESIRMWRFQAGAKGLAFLAEVAPEIPSHVRGDPHRLRQIINNLTANAIKFTAQGQVRFHAELMNADDRRVVVRFSIIDTGIGIPPSQVAALFSPFVQADESTTRNYGGTGLGLAICKHLVEMMGGEIGVESGPSQGSTFWFTVAFEASDMGAPTATVLPMSGHAGAGPGHTVNGAGLRVLVAEDNHINRLVLRTQLEKFGFSVETVINGAEAVEATIHRAYDLVLMDCEMPGMDGFEATRRIRQTNAGRVPIIAVTAHAMSGDRERCILAGMDDFLSKPVDMQLLAQLLAKWCAPQPRT